MTQERLIDFFSQYRKGRIAFLFPGVIFNRQVKITRAGASFLVLIILVLVASLNTANNLLYLIVGVMISLLAASFYLSESTIDLLRVERTLPEQAQANSDFTITYRLTNQKSIMPTLGMMIEDMFEGNPCRVFFPGVRAGRSEVMRATTRASRRGRLRMDRLTVSTRHPFGFFFKSKFVNLAGEIVVCPHMEKITSDISLPPYLAGEMRAAKKGEGDELFGFRDYTRGDNPRLIHWKVSAKAGKLLARELEEEKKRAVIIEPGVSGIRPEVDDPEREEIISRAASLAKYFLDINFQVRVEVSGRGLEFGEGAAHLGRILYFLAVFDDPEKPWLGELLEPVASVSRVSASAV